MSSIEDVNNLYGCTKSQKLPLINFERNKDVSRFNEGFTKNRNEERDEGYFFKVGI